MTTLVQRPSEEHSLDDIIHQCQNIITEIRGGERTKRPLGEAVEMAMLLTQRCGHGRETHTLPVSQETSVWRNYHHMVDGMPERVSSPVNIPHPGITRQNAVCYESVTNAIIEDAVHNPIHLHQTIAATAARNISTSKENIRPSAMETKSKEKYNAGVKNNRRDKQCCVLSVARDCSDNVSPCSSLRHKLLYSEKCRQVEKSFFIKVTSQFGAINKDIVHIEPDLHKRSHEQEPEVNAKTKLSAPLEYTVGE